jgi:hypothetical protein
MVAVSLHTSSILYFTCYLLTFLFDIKKDSKVFILSLLFIISFTGFPFELVRSSGIAYLNSRFLIDISNRESLPLFLKFSYYLLFYILVDYLMIGRVSSNKQISLFVFLTFSISTLIIQNDVFLMRYLFILDFSLPIIFLSKSIRNKNKEYFFLAFFSVIIVYIFSLYTEEFSLNFNF